MIPIANNFLYVEPLYLLSESNELPELKQVIVATGDRIAMEQTLDEALFALLEDEVPRVSDTGVETGDTDDTSSEADSEATTAADGSGEVSISGRTVDEIIESANQNFEASEAARAAGDWATFGEALALLEADLQELAELTNE